MERNAPLFSMQPKSRGDVAQLDRQLFASDRRGVRELRQVKPPAADEKAVNTVISTLAEVIDDSERKALEFERTGRQSGSFGDRQTKLRYSAGRTVRGAQTYGVTQCLEQILAPFA
jgi:hypothetical protein